MKNMEYANAYTEVLEILKCISEEDYNKIPNEKVKLFETNANKEYKFNYNSNLTLNEQNISKRAKAIIAILFRDYWATSEQKEKILAKQNFDRVKIEKDKYDQYDPNDIFKNNTKENYDNVNNNLPIEIKKDNIFKKLINFIRNLFAKK